MRFKAYCLKLVLWNLVLLVHMGEDFSASVLNQYQLSIVVFEMQDVLKMQIYM